MKRWLIILALIGVSASSKHSVSVKLCIKGIAEKSGNLMIAVYSSADQFPDFGKGDINIVHAVRYTTENIVVNGLKEGESYALAVYHDANKNKFLDKNFLGMPIERYGFSNDARGTFGPPYFSEAAFKATNGKKLTITIR